MDKPLVAFYAIVLILVWLFDAAFGPVRAAPIVSPGNISPSDMAWLQQAMSEQGQSFNALLNKSVPSVMTTSLGKSIPLPANWAANIPRSTLAASAAKILKKAGPYGIVAYALYDYLSPLIALNPDGSIDGSDPVYTFTWSGGTNPWTGVYYGPVTGSPDIGSACAAQQTGCNNMTNPSTGVTCSAYVRDSSSCFFKASPTASPSVFYPAETCSSGSLSNHRCIGGDGSSTIPLTESELAEQIQSSAATEKLLLDHAIADAAYNDLPGTDVIPPATPATITVSPVTAPPEVISTKTINNPDGTTSTETVTETATAEPEVTGSTSEDAILNWKTKTQKQTQTTNNTTGQTTTQTETQYQGTSSTQTAQQPDYGTFTGTGPGDGYADGLAFIGTKLCGGNCLAAFSCATGNCTVAERITALKTKYSVSPSASGTCPSIDMDLSAQGFGVHHVTEHCDLAETVRGVVAVIISVLTAAAVISIVLSA